ncbi:MAG: nucleotidyltransferase family protein [Coprothermobacterota bacterium]|jgi:molybdenum cofactor cytidylyltransferase|nr:nucleotidyltransferase family protein [Coprothermobacterota bacterium]
MKKVAALILAAGKSLRMGQPKMLMPWKGRSLLSHVVENVLKGEFSNVVVVTGDASEQTQSAVKAIADPRLRCAFNKEYALGMLSSVQCGILALSDPLEGVMIALGDQPAIPAQTYQQLLAHFVSSDALILIPSFRQKRGHPIFLRSALFFELLALDPARDSLHNITSGHASMIQTISLEEPAIVQDLDTPGDYEQLTEKEGFDEGL